MPSLGHREWGQGEAAQVSTLLNNSVSVELRRKRRQEVAWARVRSQEALGSKASHLGLQSPAPQSCP